MLGHSIPATRQKARSTVSTNMSFTRRLAGVHTALSTWPLTSSARNM